MPRIIIEENGRRHEVQISDADFSRLISKPSEPTYEEPYYYILANGKIRSGSWVKCGGDYERLSFGNAFITEEQAKGALRALKLIQSVAKRRRELNGDWEFHFKDCADFKYAIGYDSGGLNDDPILIEYHTDNFDSANVFGYFEDETDVYVVIFEFNEELLWYFEEYLPNIN